METKNTRRDLLNGIVIGAGGSFLQAYSGRAVGNPTGTAGFEPNAMPSYYPPILTFKKARMRCAGSVQTGRVKTTRFLLDDMRHDNN